MNLPDLETFQYGRILGEQFSWETSESSDTESSPSTVATDEDVWKFTPEYRTETTKSQRTWHPGHVRKSMTYPIEARPGAFDAAYPRNVSVNEASLKESTTKATARLDPSIAALLQLGLGRESSMYKYETKEHGFLPCIPDLQISDFTLQSSRSLASIFVTYGNQMRTLRAFVSQTYKSKNSCPSSIALAATIASAIYCITAFIIRRSIDVCTVLQLQSLFYRVGFALDCLSTVVDLLRRFEYDDQILSRLYRFAQDMEYSSDSLRPLVWEILSRVCEPWLQGISQNLGLLHSDQTNYKDDRIPSHEHLELEHGDSYSDEAQRLPEFLAKEDRERIFCIFKNLQLLKTYMPYNAILSSEVLASCNPPSLKWHFEWADVEKIQTEANNYEAKTGEVISCKSIPQFATSAQHQDVKSVVDWNLDPFCTSDDNLEQQLFYSQICIEDAHDNFLSVQATDPLSQIFSDILSENGKGEVNSVEILPPLSLAPISSFRPIFSAQLRLVNLACLQLLLQEHGLRSHLKLLSSFYLFGNGVFVSRLSYALFDSSPKFAERRTGMETMGINFDYRDTWLPAGLELRLLLTSILTDCYKAAKTEESIRSPDTEVPGGLSFALRDIPEAETRKCPNSHSVEALDFLRLRYKPSPPLNTVITPLSLERYDQIFKVLLRMVGMLSVVGQLCHRSGSRLTNSDKVDSIAARFRFEARFFVYTVCGYFFNTGVAETWKRFDRFVADLELRLENYRTSAPIGELEGLQQLRIYHEEMLGVVMHTLLLRKSQEAVLQILTDVFNSILAFAKYEKETEMSGTGAPNRAGKVEATYNAFRSKVTSFVAGCKDLRDKHELPGLGLAGRGGLFSSILDDAFAGDTIGQLLLALDMNGYFSRSMGLP